MQWQHACIDIKNCDASNAKTKHFSTYHKANICTSNASPIGYLKYKNGTRKKQDDKIVDKNHANVKSPMP